MVPKRAMRLLSFLLISIFLISFISAANFDNIKEEIDFTKGNSLKIGTRNVNYRALWEKYKPIRIKNWFGLGNQRLWEGTLNEHTENCGTDCFSIMDINLAKDGTLIEDVRFITITDEEEFEQNIRNYNFYIKTDEEEYSVDDYEYQCSEREIYNAQNDTTYTEKYDCSNVKVGAHIETRNLWEGYEMGTSVPRGDYQVKLEGKKKPSRTVDWQIKAQGKWIDEWAVWGNISAGDDAEVLLNSPEDNYLSLTSEVSFNCSANITGGATITNISLWHNGTGTWEINQTIQGAEVVEAPNQATYDQTPSWTSATTGGFKVTAQKDTQVNSITKDNSCTATTAWVKDASHSILGTATFSGDIAIFSTPIQLTNGIDYYLETGVLSGSYDGRSSSGGGGSFPDPDTEVNWIGGWYGSDSSSGGANLISANFSGRGLTSTQIFTTTITEPTLWTCQACDSDGDCGFASENRTVLVDTIDPTIEIISPTATVDYGIIGGTFNLSWNVTDTNLDSIWYNYNGTNVTVYGSYNSTLVTIESYENRNLTLYANDSVLNSNSSFISWDYLVWQGETSFNNETTEGASETFTTNITVGGGGSLSEASLIYNGTSYTSSIDFSGGVYSISSTITIPTVSEDSTMFFNFNVTVDSTSYSLNQYNQTVDDLEFGLCGGASNDALLNMTLVNEITKDNITGDIQISAEIINKLSGETIETISKGFNGTNSAAICFSPTSAYDLYYFDATIRYTSDGYDSEFYTIQKADLGDYPLNLTLFDLNSNDSTEFLIKYQDDALIAVEGAVIQLLRMYISEDVYEVVEAPLTSNIGTAVVHIDLDTNKYKAIVVKDGVVLDIFTNLVFDCESELSGQCTQNLFGSINPHNSVSTESLNDFTYDVTSINNTITTSFTIPSGTPATVNIVLTQKDLFGNSTLCNQTIYSSAGSIDCNYDDTIGDSMVTLEILKNTELEGQQEYLIKEGGGIDWLGNNYFIVLIFLLSLTGIAVSSPEWIVINGVLTMVLAGGLWLLNGLDFVVGLGGLIWLIIAAGLLILKLSKQEDR